MAGLWHWLHSVGQAIQGLQQRHSALDDLERYAQRLQPTLSP
jgi:hypothetical protein